MGIEVVPLDKKFNLMRKSEFFKRADRVAYLVDFTKKDITLSTQVLSFWEIENLAKIVRACKV